jgi:hypothetical protein
LIHLRALAASLHERLEQAEAALERAHADTQAAWADADMWRDQAQNLIEDLQDAGREVGLTEIGQLMAMPTSAGVDIDAVHRVHTSVQEGSEAKFNGLHGVAA